MRAGGGMQVRGVRSVKSQRGSGAVRQCRPPGLKLQGVCCLRLVRGTWVQKRCVRASQVCMRVVHRRWFECLY